MADGLDKGYSIVQHSENGKDFVSLDTLQSSATQLLYQYMDYNSMSEENYYRVLYITDENSQYFSKVIYMNAANTGNLYSIAPNPAKGHFTVFNRGIKEHVKYEITDALGRLIHSTTVSQDHAQINTNGWEPGIYFIKGSTLETSLTYKMVVE